MFILLAIFVFLSCPITFRDMPHIQVVLQPGGQGVVEKLVTQVGTYLLVAISDDAVQC